MTEQCPLRINILVKYRLPSLNALFGMNHWQRTKEKKAEQAAFVSALRHAAIASSIPTISAPSILSMLCDTAEHSLMTEKRTSTSRAGKKKSRAKRKKL
mgnify:CR=1 FL=1|jgi:predicted xylose isomerase-like sugar epimerase|tara:strand:- start:74 stop:370 length:297 start_codon:yes stop_codon:yes gene_type:complete